MCEDDLRGDIPTGWWITANKNCFYLLAALVHRNNPDIVPDPTDSAAGDTRNNIRKKVADARAEEATAAKVAPTTNKGKLEESMMSTKAVLMEQSVSLQQIEGVKEQLMMMKEFQSSFVNMHDQAKYDETVCNMLSELPIMKKRKADAGTSGDSTIN